MYGCLFSQLILSHFSAIAVSLGVASGLLGRMTQCPTNEMTRGWCAAIVERQPLNGALGRLKSVVGWRLRWSNMRKWCIAICRIACECNPGVLVVLVPFSPWLENETNVGKCECCPLPKGFISALVYPWELDPHLVDRWKCWLYSTPNGATSWWPVISLAVKEGGRKLGWYSVLDYWKVQGCGVNPPKKVMLQSYR